MRLRRVAVLVSVAALAAGLAIACTESEPITVGRGLEPTSPAPGSTPPPGDPAAGGAGPEAGAEGGEPEIVPLSYRDEDFVEGETNRDPFRSYAQLFVTTPTKAQKIDRAVIMPRTSIDEMRLIAIISAVASPSAMIVDREGTGHTVHRGDFLGRAEVVQTGGDDAVPITLNWRVDRIRPAEVVLTREDPTAPNRPPLTRVMALHGEDEADDTGTL
jgi:hypothetical protein